MWGMAIDFYKYLKYKNDPEYTDVPIDNLKLEYKILLRNLPLDVIKTLGVNPKSNTIKSLLVDLFSDVEETVKKALEKFHMDDECDSDEEFDDSGITTGDDPLYNTKEIVNYMMTIIVTYTRRGEIILSNPFQTIKFILLPFKVKDDEIYEHVGELK